MSAGEPDFRLGAVLATSFTGTRTERCGDPVERIPTARRLMDWLALQQLSVQSCDEDELDRAKELREAVHSAATAVALGTPAPVPAVRVINRCSEHGRAAVALTSAGISEWRLHSRSIDDALSVIAADAIAILSGDRSGRLALCSSPTCRAAFFDTIQSRSRVWCDMNTCGNQQKKARLRAKSQ